MKFSWVEHNNNGKYQQLYHAHRLLEIYRLNLLLEILEPINDVSQAAKYLNKFRQEK